MVMMAAITQTQLLRVLLVIFLSLKFQTISVQPQSFLTTEEDHALAKNYLKAFGYLAKNNASNLPKDLESATRKFQEFYNLKISGKLDAETMKVMSKSRCGVRDGDEYPGRPRSRWPPNKRHLTYMIKSQEVDDDDEVTSLLGPVLQEAFLQWSQVTNFTFEEAAFGAPSSDLMLGFYRRYHGDCCPFDGPGNVLAHAFDPPDGRLHYDGEEQWSRQVPPEPENATDLVYVGIHEIGHLLGLVHSQDPNAIMYPLIPSGVNKRTLTADDIAAIKALYPQG